MSDLQERAANWHRQRFPDADQYHVALKSMEELGEVAEALNSEAGRKSATATAGDVVAEAADVIICMLVLVGRWRVADLLDAVDRKLVTLETAGAHRASLLEVP